MIDSKANYWKYALIILIVILGTLIVRESLPFMGGILGACTIYVMVRGQMLYLCEKKKIHRTLSAVIVLAETIMCFLIPAFLAIWLLTDRISNITLEPTSLIENIKISLPTLLLLLAIIVSSFLFFINRKSKMLVYCLSLIFVKVLFHIFGNFVLKKNMLSIYNSDEKTKIEWNIGAENFMIDTIGDNEYIQLKEKNFLSFTSDKWKNKRTDTPLTIDYLHIVKGDSISLYSLTQTFCVRHVILDNTLSTRNRNRLIRECRNMNIQYFDMEEKGAFRIFF